MERQRCRSGGKALEMRNGSDHAQPSRRRLLRYAGGAGLVAAAATAAQLASPAAAQASDGDTVILGTDNDATSTTSIITIDNDAFQAGSTQKTGVAGSSEFGTGVSGVSPFGFGVTAQSNTGTALQAQSESGLGVDASSNSAAGVQGTSFSGTGVVGNSTDGKGVTGTSVQDAGVQGTSEFGAGVAGQSGSGDGVSGASVTGVGVLAKSTDGVALQVTGPASFSRAGLVAIGPGTRSATVTVPGGLSAGSMVLALLQTDLPLLYVVSAIPSAATGAATINLNRAPANAAMVAWFVIG
jgi:hypothetical protein